MQESTAVTIQPKMLVIPKKTLLDTIGGTVESIRNRDDIPRSYTLEDAYQKDYALLAGMPGNDSQEMAQSYFLTQQVCKKASLKKNIFAVIGFGLMAGALLTPAITNSAEKVNTPGVTPPQSVLVTETDKSIFSPKTAKALQYAGLGCGMAGAAIMVLGTNAIGSRKELSVDQLDALEVWYNHVAKGMIEWQNMQNGVTPVTIPQAVATQETPAVTA